MLVSNRVRGGRVNYLLLTNKIPPAEYAKAKAQLWLAILNMGDRPTRWNKPNKNGTTLTFERITEAEDYTKGLNELRSYVEEINKEFDLDIKITVD